MISWQHRHKGWTWDGAKISYNDLTDKPTAAASTQFAAWQAVFTWSWDTVITTWFAPKLIQFYAIWTISQWSNIESWCACFWTYITATNTWSSTRLWHITDSNSAAWWWWPRADQSSTSAIVLSAYNSSWTMLNIVWNVVNTTSTSFTIWMWTFWFSSCRVQWTAFG